ncbi:AraC family transcriptional regulator [Metabacillus dongyingensis]|uniref:AraC family transcriptional regulator n=1 Tax=Metabacillus dongyingensis TaxID=2874282 RepID=UPI003B8C27B8
MPVSKYQSSEYMCIEEFPFWIKTFHHDISNLPPLHSHEFIELVYVVKGEANHVFEGKSYTIRENDVFIINPGEVHTFSLDRGGEFEIINCLFLPSLIQDSWLKAMGVSQSMDYFFIHPFLDSNERFHHLLNLNDDHFLRIRSLLESMISEFEGANSCFSTLIRIQLVELLILLSRIYNERKRIPCHVSSVEKESKLLVQRICGYIERHYDQKISIPTICHLFCISPRHLNRLFKQELGKTVIEMAHKIRIEKAKKILIESNEKVLNVAMRVGYDDPAFFSRLFRRVVGCSPGKYKNNVSKEIIDG